MPDRRGRDARGGRRYPRTLRVNELLREVIAEELREIDDDRLRLVTVTGVESDPDVRHATVLLASLSPEVAEALEEHRTALQAAIGRQSHLKRTPILAFAADPAVESGWKVEEILRGIETTVDPSDGRSPADGEGEGRSGGPGPGGAGDG